MILNLFKESDSIIEKNLGKTLHAHLHFVMLDVVIMTLSQVASRNKSESLICWFASVAAQITFDKKPTKRILWIVSSGVKFQTGWRFLYSLAFLFCAFMYTRWKHSNCFICSAVVIAGICFVGSVEGILWAYDVQRKYKVL